ncbi:hypothetical protein SLS62_011370 [Diatrype stigma]|uniref:FAD-binding PCMH-type domain-containing protein n=1 Tax=Diatrype stigma TaxID=117547 RepID=A0AAN9U463_9PEZI
MFPPFIEFFAYGRGHGISTSVASFQGLQINLGQLNAITIAEDGKSARFQGGLDNGQVLGNVWDQGYVTTTGTATCVGLLGAGLGGGHGVYEGQYGLVIDNLIHVNIVLANGTAIGVNETSYPDLWWGIRGAGHNFGIVTSADMKIYPREIETWHYKNYWWAGEKLEEVLEALNTFHTSDNGTTPPLMGFEAGQFTMNTSVSETEATLFWSFAYAGTGEEAEKLLEPFNAIENLGVRSGDTGLPSLSNDMSAFGEGAACAPIWFVGASTLIGQYNITAMRQVYDLYNSKAAEYPELGASSQIYIEGYATKGMEVVPADTTAFIQFSLAEGSELHDTAEAWAKQTWDLWVEGEGPGAQPAHYVNYVLWNPWETRESIYGPEPWRLERLNQLKGQYDPENRFRFYVPILE